MKTGGNDASMAKPLPLFSRRPSQTLIMLPVLVSLLLPSYALEDPTIIWCPHTSNYTTTSQFKRNLDRLLTNLSTVPANVSPTHFQSSSAGDADAAYGVVQCSGDVLSEDCASCLRRTAKEVVSRCAHGRVAAIRYNTCLLRYSDRPVYGVLEQQKNLWAWNVQDATDIAVFNERLTELLREILSVAAEGSSRFSTGIKNFSEFGNIYGLAQCTRDLSTGNCKRCLSDLAANLVRGKIGGRAACVSCYMPFEVTSFFPQTIVPPPPAAVGSAPTTPTTVPLPADGDHANSRGRMSKTVALSVGITSAVVVISVVLGIIVCFKRTRRTEITKRTMPKPTEAFPRASLAFDLEVLKAATENFSDANKVGEGGFGIVYKVCINTLLDPH